MKQKAVGGPTHRHVELARQVAGPIGAQQKVLDGPNQGTSVQEFVRINARKWITRDVAGVVMTRLAAGQTHPLQGIEQGRHVLQQETAQLNVLSGGDISTAMLATAIDHLRKQLQLISADDPIRQPQPQHESAGGDRTKKDSQPLEMDGEGRLIKGFPAHAG